MRQQKIKVSKTVALLYCDSVFLTAIDRVHRIGQEKTVYVTHFIVGVIIQSLG